MKAVTLELLLEPLVERHGVVHGGRGGLWMSRAEIVELVVFEQVEACNERAWVFPTADGLAL